MAVRHLGGPADEHADQEVPDAGDEIAGNEGERAPGGSGASPIPEPNAAAIRVDQRRSPLAAQRMERNTRPPSSGKAGIMLKTRQHDVEPAEVLQDAPDRLGPMRGEPAPVDRQEDATQHDDSRRDRQSP